MIKQRFVVYKSLDNNGKVLRYLLVVGGKNIPFLGDLRGQTHLGRTSAYLIGQYGCSSFPLSGWMDFARRSGASRIQKVIYFN